MVVLFFLSAPASSTQTNGIAALMSPEPPLQVAEQSLIAQTVRQFEAKTQSEQHRFALLLQSRNRGSCLPPGATAAPGETVLDLLQQLALLFLH